MGKRQIAAEPVDVLGAILGGAAPVSVETRGGALHLVELDRILDNPFQARQEDDVPHVLGIAESMANMKRDLPQTLGMQQPPTGRLVRLFGDQVEPFDPFVYRSERTIREALAMDDTRVQLHFGHSRRQAFRVLAFGVADVWPDLAGNVQGPALDADYGRMPLFLAHADRRALLVHVATENARRKDLSAIEEAVLLRRAIGEGMTTEEAGGLFGWARSTAANKLRLLELPPDVQQMVRRGTVSERAARELVRLVDAPSQLAGVLELITKGDGVSIGRLTSDVNWRVDQLKRERELAAEWAAAREILAAGWEPWPGAGVVGVERMGFADGVQDWQHEVFVQGSEACAVCTSACPCMRVIQGRGGVNAVRSSGAPSVAVACADRQRLRDLLAARVAVVAADPALAADAQAAAWARDAEVQRLAQERRDRLEAVTREGDALWADFLANLSRPALWGRLAFWQVATEFVWSLRETLAGVDTESAAVDAVLEKMRVNGCRVHMPELGDWVIDPGKLKELITRLEGKRKKVKEDPPAE